MRPAVIGLVALPVIVGGLGVTAAVVVFGSGSSADQGQATSTPTAGADSSSTTESHLHDTRIHGTRPHLTVIQGGANPTGLGAIPAILSALPPLATDLAPLSAAEEHAPAGIDQGDGQADGPGGGRPDPFGPAPGSLPSAPVPAPGGSDPRGSDRPGSVGGAMLGERRGDLPPDPLSRLGPATDDARAGVTLLDVGPRGAQAEGERPGTSGPEAGPGSRPGDASPGDPSPAAGWRNPLQNAPGQGAGPRQGAPPHADTTGRPPHADTTGPPPHARHQTPPAGARGARDGGGGGGGGGGGDYSETVTYLHPEAG